MKKEEKTRLLSQMLEDMVGCSYNYGRSEHRIMRYRIDEEKERVYLLTDKKEYDRDFESMSEFLNLFEPIEQRKLPTRPEPEVILPQAQINGSVLTQLKDVLMDNIKKVQNNASYIPQAQAIKDNVDSIIDLAKTEVQQLELLYKLKKNGDV